MIRKYLVIIGILSLISIVAFLLYRKVKTVTKQHNRKLLETKIENMKKTAPLSPYNCTIPYPIFYINMDKDIERRNHVESQLRNINCLYMRIRGVEGSKITDTKEDTVEGIKFRNSYNLSKSELGCFLSQFKAIETAYLMGLDVVIICEDDIAFFTCPFVPKVKTVIENGPPDWEILQLYTGSGSISFDNYKTKKGLEYVRREAVSDLWSCACYAINRKGMKKLIDIVKPNDTILIEPHSIVNGKPYPYEGPCDKFIYDTLNTYNVLPSLFLTDNSNHESTIHTDHTDLHLKSSLETLNDIEKWYIKK
jgi:GR25 family glycosyltransferase involved in LPS biosynthesis